MQHWGANPLHLNLPSGTLAEPLARRERGSFAEGILGIKAEDGYRRLNPQDWLLRSWGTWFTVTCSVWTHATERVTSTPRRNAHIQTLISGWSGEVQCTVRHTFCQSGVYRHDCECPPHPPLQRPFRLVAVDWCSCEAGVRGDQSVVSASSALSSAEKNESVTASATWPRRSAEANAVARGKPSAKLDKDIKPQRKPTLVWFSSV